jgi:hypothetical protein
LGKEKSIKNMETIKPRMKLLILPKAIKKEKMSQPIRDQGGHVGF